MGKRYYCDYCERSFMDSANNRKKHINGVLHHKQRKLHYDRFRDTSTILLEEKSKKPCMRHIQTGYCEFGNSCRYGHLTPEELYQLEAQASFEQARLTHKTQPVVESDVIVAWVNKVTKLANQACEPKNAELQTLEESLNIDSWKLPRNIQINFNNLPPSLLPPTIDEVLDHFTTWGECFDYK